MTAHQWSTTPLDNQTADARAQFQEGQPASSLNDGCRGMMASSALWRDDNIGVALTAAAGPKNAYTLTTGQGLIDPTTVGGTPAITHPFSLRINFSAAPTGLTANPLTLAIDGAAAAAVTRADGTPLVEGDIKASRSYLIVGYAFTSGALTQIRVLSMLPSEVSASLGNVVRLTAQSLSGSTGYRVWSDGAVEQWGFASTSGDTTVGFPIQFPNACRSVVVTPVSGATASAFVAMIDAIAPTSFVVRPRQIDPGSVIQAYSPVYWYARGF
ncbi:hypothetical protein [Methylobacterium sp. WL7]|uniref:gp53-like domain-containing protein n=1 Tax=Methylobacterium sp. WL7 TaxID=2603900 RepID=UPI0011C7D75F|nr:hypothetical protein [Methylobacterium sp. WL7]TXN43582.1 hypothetical protein FV233_17955 [Methylobacterium sp. WL7]